MIAWSHSIYMHTKFELNWTNGSWDTKENEIWPLTFICITKMASYQFHFIMWFDCLVTLHMHTKIGLNWTNGFWDTKQRKIWPLTFICIAKMASYQLDVIMTYVCLITLHMHTKSGLKSDPRLLRYKTKEDLTFDLHLHNQDGLIWSWCFYVIWSSGHTPYAYKI